MLVSNSQYEASIGFLAAFISVRSNAANRVFSGHRGAYIIPLGKPCDILLYFQTEIWESITYGIFTFCSSCWNTKEEIKMAGVQDENWDILWGEQLWFAQHSSLLDCCPLFQVPSVIPMWKKKKKGNACCSNTKLTRNNQSIIPYVNLILNGIKVNGLQNRMKDLT